MERRSKRLSSRNSENPQGKGEGEEMNQSPSDESIQIEVDGEEMNQSPEREGEEINQSPSNDCESQRPQHAVDTDGVGNAGPRPNEDDLSRSIVHDNPFNGTSVLKNINDCLGYIQYLENINKGLKLQMVEIEAARHREKQCTEKVSGSLRDENKLLHNKVVQIERSASDIQKDLDHAKVLLSTERAANECLVAKASQRLDELRKLKKSIRELNLGNKTLLQKNSELKQDLEHCTSEKCDMQLKIVELQAALELVTLNEEEVVPERNISSSVRCTVGTASKIYELTQKCKELQKRHDAQAVPERNISSSVRCTVGTASELYELTQKCEELQKRHDAQIASFENALKELTEACISSSVTSEDSNKDDDLYLEIKNRDAKIAGLELLLKDQNSEQKNKDLQNQKKLNALKFQLNRQNAVLKSALIGKFDVQADVLEADRLFETASKTWSYFEDSKRESDKQGGGVTQKITSPPTPGIVSAATTCGREPKSLGDIAYEALFRSRRCSSTSGASETDKESASKKMKVDVSKNPWGGFWSWSSMI